LFDVDIMKTIAVSVSGLAKDALHVHVGLLIFFAVRMLWRGRGGTMAAWLVVLAVTLGGEWVDRLGEAARQVEVPITAHIKDIWNTMLWPTLLALLWRWLPSGNHRKSTGE
jgi:hypothetical protein